MPRSRRLLPVVVVSLTVAVGTMLAFDAAAPLLDGPAMAPAALPLTHVAANLRTEAMSLFAAGELPPACERFRRAADDEPARADAASCFETWAWRALRENQPDEAQALFTEGLRERPGTPGLLRGLGLALIHAGRLADAIDPLETAATLTGDPDVRLLLARLYDQRDEATAARRHLGAVLAREPRHPRALALLGKLDREQGAEAGAHRETTTHFAVKWREENGAEPSRAVLNLLEAAYARLDGQLGYRPLARVTVILYGEQQFRDVTRVHAGADGVFDGKIRLPIGTTPPPGPVLERLIVHEYAHAAIHDLSRGRAPRWLHEGLAQLLEGTTADAALRVGGPVTLAGLDSLLADADPAHARAGYDVALWIVHDLFARGGMPSLRSLLDRLAAGETAARALDRVYAVRLRELESQWRHLLSG